MKNLIIIFVFAICFWQVSVSQSKIRSYGSNNAAALLDSAEYCKSKDAVRAYNFVEKALEVILQTNDKISEVRAYSTLGDINLNSGQYDLSTENYLKAIQLSNSIQKKDLSYHSRKNIGLAYQKNGDYDKALYYLNSFLADKSNKLSLDDMVFAKIHMAEIYELKGENLLAEQTYKEALEIEKNRNNTDGIILIQDKLADLNIKKDDAAGAIRYYEESERIAKEASDQKLFMNSIRKKGDAYRLQDKVNDELKARQQALEINESLGDKDAQSEDLLKIGNIYVDQNQEGRAIPVLEKSVDLSDQTRNIAQKKEALYSLSKAYEKLDPNKALETYKEYLKVNDSLNTNREKELLSRIDMATSLNRKQQRIDLLEKNKELNDKTIEILTQERELKDQAIKMQRITIVALVIILLVLTVSSVLILRSVRQKRFANQLLALKSLRSQMNPHFIFNALNSVNNYIAKNDKLSANRYLSDFAFLMRSVMENSKYDFIALTDEVKIIELYLKLEHERFKEKFDYMFSIDEDVNTESFMIPPMLIQPYIENAVWHGLRYKEEKGILQVELKQVDNCLEITIIDDGIGRIKSQEIKTKNQRQINSTGLKNIENRLKIINKVHHLGIKVEVSDLIPETHSGTCVKIIVPENEKNT
ncbi:histidine kinase [Saccharicrinis sp. FJH62]|uniref:tetratricopeptide repeat-containing sensor histidine kinase n=1 Tax=Saccharicrinis sp. FJH62 TaxID=3344657 RepID=UPI0035D442B8